MCHFITMTVHGPLSGLETALKAARRRMSIVRNESVQPLLVEGEHQALAQYSHCDCGTVLGASRSTTPEAAAAEEQKMRDRLERKGWSAAKIDRSVDASRKAQERPGKKRGAEHGFDYWAGIVRAVLEQPDISSVGILVHGYSGAIEAEEFEPTRRNMPRDIDVEAALADLREDELMVFPKSGVRSGS